MNKETSLNDERDSMGLPNISRREFLDSDIKAYGMLLPMMIGRATRKVGQNDAEDVVQEALRRGFKAVETKKTDADFQEDGSLAKYLLQILNNTVKNHWKKSRVREKYDGVPSSLENEEEFVFDPGNTEAIVECKLTAKEIKNAIKDPNIKEALELRERGFSYLEIADIQNVPIGTVSKRISLARKYIKAIIQEDA
jgi:RNA polymerase sigma factor (sigma-70 family)